jgi:hypothetical protein
MVREGDWKRGHMHGSFKVSRRDCFLFKVQMVSSQPMIGHVIEVIFLA